MNNVNLGGHLTCPWVEEGQIAPPTLCCVNMPEETIVHRLSVRSRMSQQPLQSFQDAVKEFPVHAAKNTVQVSVGSSK